MQVEVREANGAGDVLVGRRAVTGTLPPPVLLTGDYRRSRASAASFSMRANRV